MTIEANFEVALQKQCSSEHGARARHGLATPRMRVLAAAILACTGMLFAGAAAAAGTDDPPGTLISALPFGDSGSTVGFNNTYTNYGGPCAASLASPYPGEDAFYSVHLNAGATYTFSLDLANSDGDLAMFLLSNSADPASCLATSQDAVGPGAGPELITITPATSQDYFLSIDSYYAAGTAGSSGIYSLSVECTAGDCGTADSADLSITKDDGVTDAAAGSAVTYTITASNAGPSAVASATVTDNFPAECATVSWTCTGASGGTCTASGTGNIVDAAVLPVGASVAYSATCNIDAMATGTLANTATVSSATSDPDSANNSATDTDTLTVNPNDVIFIDGFDDVIL